ncbi:hypothetical protein GTZ99_01515 [Novosphingobium sp. FSY-8]|uniref:Uncharacterized protein n=1 Tax=Novosphingobium ovatum TaxID=1908523 RepID=A0ABW9X9N9_9SPHN|nr:hypothetical protein [Novosphingobium ovatum]NBC35233.1 hypothetical protein [Novosphingobium ovatum]
MSLNPTITLIDDGARITLAPFGRQDVARALVGLTPMAALALVGRLYALCPMAQGWALRGALQAGGADLPPAPYQAGWLWAEIARELGLRIVMDWAVALGRAAQGDAARALLALTTPDAGRGPDAAGLGDWSARHVFAMRPRDWARTACAGQLADWAGGGATLAARAIAHVMARPTLCQPAPVEPGSLLHRHATHPLIAALPPGSVLARLVAQLLDLATVPDQMAVAGRLGASVPCSRGTLTHALRLQSGLIVEARIDAPTDRAYATGGAAQAVLATICAPDAGISDPVGRRDLATWAMLGLNPCVGWSILTRAIAPAVATRHPAATTEAV